MKKVFTLFAALFACIGLANAQTLTIPDVYIRPGEKASFGLIVNVPANSYAAFQFETTFPEGITYTEETTVSESWDGNFSTSKDNNKGSAISTKSTPIPSGSIAIATAEITADAALDLNEYEVTISNFEFIGYSGGADDKKIEDVTFKVIVTDKLILDENSAVSPSNASGVDVIVKRTINANKWSTIILPFAMNAIKAKKAFGDDVQLASFDSFEVTYGDGDIAQSVNLNFKTVTGFAAGTPCLIKTSKDIESFELSGVTVNNSIKKVTRDEEINFSSCAMTGTLAKTKIPANGLFISNGEFYFSTGKTEIKGFRCWFVVDAVNVMPSAARVKLSVTDGDGNTTNIDPRTMQTIEDGKVYNMNGQYVGEAEDANSLPKGVYIVNGKKKVIK